MKPVGNKQKGKFAQSDDLRKRFRRDIKRNVLAKVDGLFAEYRSARSRRKSAIEKSDGRTPDLLKYVSGPMKLRAHFKGRIIKARVRRDGSVRFAGKVYTSPSVAGAAAVKRRSCNGWKFWHYERAPGDWILLDILRQ